MTAGRPPDIDRIPEAWLLTYAGIAGAVCAAAIMIHVATYTTPAIADALRAVTQALLFVNFAMAGGGILTMRIGSVNFSRLIDALPVAIKILGALAGVAFEVYWLQLFFQGPPPTAQDGYLQELLHQVRMMSGQEIVFSGLLAVGGYQMFRLRRGRLRPRVTAATRELPGPLPPPFGRRLAFTASLTPGEAIARIRRTVDEGRDDWFGTRMPLTGWSAGADFGFALRDTRWVRPYAVATGSVHAGAATTVTMVVSLTRWIIVPLLLAPALLAAVGIALDMLAHMTIAAITLGGLAVVSVPLNFGNGLLEGRRLVSEIRRLLE